MRGAFTPLRDTLLVARFELLRSVRTRMALTLITLYALVAAGAAGGFVAFLHMVEVGLAETLKVPVTRRPGAMMERLLEEPEVVEAISELIENPEVVEAWLVVPILVIVHLAAAALVMRRANTALYGLERAA